MSSIPYIYKKGDLVEGKKENQNHRYLKKIILEDHDHSGYGNGGDLVNPINTGPFVTDRLVVNDGATGGLGLVDLMGNLSDGGYLYVSEWTTLVMSTTLTFNHNYSTIHGAWKNPYIIQVHLGIDPIETNGFQIAEISHEPYVTDSFTNENRYTYFRGVFIFSHPNFTNISTHSDGGIYGVASSKDAGTGYFSLPETETIKARVIALY